MRIILALVAVLFSFSLTSPAIAKMERYHFDKKHTQILFFVDHLGFSKSQGEFLKYDGYFTFDPENVEASTVKLTIQSSSIDMDDTEWDDHMKNHDFMNITKFPEMTFTSTKVTKTGDKTGTLTGDLTLLGMTKPVTLDVTYNKSGIHPFSKRYVSGFSATGTVKRSEFGMNYGLPMIGDDVALRIEVEGFREENTPKNK